MSPSDNGRAQSPLATQARKFYPSLAFADAMSIPYKSPLSPPSTTSSNFTLSPVSSTSTASSSICFAPAAPSESLSSSSFASCAYPDWPKRHILTPLSSFCGSEASSHISDEDLLDLEQLDLCDDVRVPAEKTAGISWEATRQPPSVLHSMPVQQKARAMPQRRRRSSPLNRRKMVAGMSPIAEAPE